MAKIIHNKLPMDINGYFTVNIDVAQKFTDYIVDTLNLLAPDDHYIVLTTPFDMTMIDGKDNFISIDDITYDYNTLKEIIEKASMYDGLCK